MDFTCPHCGVGSFTIVTDVTGAEFATCNNCGKTIRFEKQQMSNSRMQPEEMRRLHIK